MRRKFYIVSFVFVLLLSMFPYTASAKEAYTIENLNITIRVQEDGKLLVQEDYDLNFNYYRSTFVRNITSTYHVPTTTDQGVIYRDYYFSVRDLTGDRLLSVTRNEDGAVVTMGEEGQQLNGHQRFSISYSVQTCDLEMADHTQMLYWTLATNFDTRVEKLHYKITMPKAFDPQEVYTNTGKYGDVKNTLSMKVTGNVISGDLQQPLENNEMATIKVNLPNNYFIFPKPIDTNIVASLASLAVLLAVGLLFWRFGRDQEIFVDVQDEAPKDISSCEIGYVMNRFADDRDLFSMFIDWGNRNFIMIHDHGKTFELEKIREMNELNAKSYERELFDVIFQTGPIVNQDDLREARIGFAFEKAKHLLERSFLTAKERRVYTDSSLILQALMAIVTMIPSLIFVGSMTFARFELFELSMKNLIPTLLLCIDMGGWVYLIRHRYVLHQKQFFFWMVVLIVAACVLLSINSITLYLFGIKIFALIVYLFVTIVLFFCMIYMDKRTRKGNEWKAEVLGIREFIETVEPEQLTVLNQRNPKLFQDFLPFAYVLNLADIWAKKFEHLPVEQPQWYDGMHDYDHFDTFLFWHTFHYCFYYMEQYTVYHPLIKEAGFFHVSFHTFLPKQKK